MCRAESARGYLLIAPSDSGAQPDGKTYSKLPTAMRRQVVTRQPRVRRGRLVTTSAAGRTAEPGERMLRVHGVASPESRRPRDTMSQDRGSNPRLADCVARRSRSSRVGLREQAPSRGRRLWAVGRSDPRLQTSAWTSAAIALREERSPAAPTPVRYAVDGGRLSGQRWPATSSSRTFNEPISISSGTELANHRIGDSKPTNGKRPNGGRRNRERSHSGRSQQARTDDRCAGDARASDRGASLLTTDCETAFHGATFLFVAEPWCTPPQLYTQPLRSDGIPPEGRSFPGHEQRHPETACSMLRARRQRPARPAPRLVSTPTLERPAVRAIAFAGAPSRLARSSWRPGDRADQSAAYDRIRPIPTVRLGWPRGGRRRRATRWRCIRSAPILRATVRALVSAKPEALGPLAFGRFQQHRSRRRSGGRPKKAGVRPTTQAASKGDVRLRRHPSERGCLR